MKKLMIAAAIALTAVASQAAVAVKWNWGGTVMNGWDDGESAQAGTMYIYNSNVAGVTRQAILDAFIADGTLGSVASMDNYTASAGTMNSMKAKTLAADYNDFAPVRGESPNAYADFFYAMIVTDTDNNKHLYISEAFDQSISTTANTYLAGNITEGSGVNFGELKTVQTGGGWYAAAAVPEPTSGLLLLLGVAGLALRRRRA